MGEYNEYSHNKNAKIELITTKNDKIDSDNKKNLNLIMIIVILDVILNVVELMDID